MLVATGAGTSSEAAQRLKLNESPWENTEQNPQVLPTARAEKALKLSSRRGTLAFATPCGIPYTTHILQSTSTSPKELETIQGI